MYEIEIKSLLGGKDKADALKTKLFSKFPNHKVLPKHKQRNHYFNTPANLASFSDAISPFLTAKDKKELENIIANVRGGVSIRTRDADGKVLVILKASIGSDSSANGVTRIEFEAPVRLTLEELDERLLNAGISYQAKWSREREEYDLGEAKVTIDKNAGYGYLAEFEKMAEKEEDAVFARESLRGLMESLECFELPQDRLERMFAFYNEHWPEYYGTERTFTIE